MEIDKNIYRRIFSRQKINIIKNGNPVCPEKNRSPEKLSQSTMRFASMGACIGKGPMCVSEMAAARIKIKSDMLFKTKGMRFGS